MTKINDIEIREPNNLNERKLFSAIMEMVEEVKHGKVEIELSIQDGKVLYIREKREKSIKLS